MCIRDSLYTAVAGARPSGSTALLEDVVVPMPALTETVGEIQRLCGRYAYDDAVIFGHAKDANLHFMINPDPVSYTHLDVYKRQMRTASATSNPSRATTTTLGCSR